MPEALTGSPRRALRVVLSVAILAEALLAVLAAVVVRAGRVPVLDVETQHRIAYGWVLFTLVAALTAYALAGGAGDRPRPGLGRALVVAGLTDGAALAGIAAFFLVPVWPILAIAGLTALLGLVLAWPRTESAPEPPGSEPGTLPAPAANAAAQGSPVDPASDPIAR